MTLRFVLTFSGTAAAIAYGIATLGHHLPKYAQGLALIILVPLGLIFVLLVTGGRND